MSHMIALAGSQSKIAEVFKAFVTRDCTNGRVSTFVVARDAEMDAVAFHTWDVCFRLSSCPAAKTPIVNLVPGNKREFVQMG